MLSPAPLEPLHSWFLAVRLGNVWVPGAAPTSPDSGQLHWILPRQWLHDLAEALGTEVVGVNGNPVAADEGDPEDLCTKG